jgi:hypothetical protein
METRTATRAPVKKSIVTNVLLDGVFLIVFLIIYEEHATGITIHEWGALALAIVAVVHILLHWSWIVAFGKRFFQNIRGDIRFNYVLNALLFLAFTAVTFSGLMMSEAVLPAIGIRLGENGFWHWLHSLTADISLGLVALHIALHWKWIFSTVKRLVKGSSAPKVAAQKPAMSASAMDTE